MLTTNLRQSPKIAAYFFCSIYILFIGTDFSFAKCISGKEGNNFLLEQYEKAKKESEVTKFIVHKYKLNKISDENNNPCTSCNNGKQPISYASKKNIEAIQQIADYKNQLLFKEECLFSAGKFEADNRDEVKCPIEELSEKFDFCINNDILTYENAVITDFFKCVKKIEDFPLMPEDLFELYSLESGFKPQYAYVGGVGIGQLTSIYVNDTLAPNRGRDVLNAISESEAEECEIANLIIKKDLKDSPKLTQMCSFIELGEGVERNILYTLVEFANIWKKDIEPAMKKFKKNDKKNLKEAQRLALLNSYGPGGKIATVAAIKRLSNLNPKEFVDRFQKPIVTKKGKNLTKYINKMDDRQDELVPYIEEKDKDNLINFEKMGAKACIN